MSKRMSKRNLTKLSGASPLSPDTIVQEQNLTQRSIRLSDEDEGEIDRIDDHLRGIGCRRTDRVKIIRLALKLALRDVDDDELRKLHQEIQIKHARGKKPILAT